MLEESYFESTWRWYLYRKWNGRKAHLRAAERHFHRVIRRFNSGLFLDAGANVGDVSAAARRHGMKVIAYEPDRTALQALRLRFASDNNVTIYPFALGGSKRTATFYQPSRAHENISATEASSLHEGLYRGDVNTYMVDVTDIRDAVRNAPERVTLLKMDIEGAEIECINALLDAGLHNEIDYILVETHERLSEEINQKMALLKKRIAEMGVKNIDLNWM